MTPSRALLAAACLAALCAHAHDVAPPAPPAPPPAPGEPTPGAAPRAQAEAWRRWGDDYRHEMQGAMGTLFAARVGSGAIVKGAPYSADVITETRQTLADGNTIEHATHGAIYRDGMGRVRQEMERGAAGSRTVYIDDPIAKAGIMVLPGGKKPIAIPSSSQRPGRHTVQAWSLDGREVRIEDGKTYIDGKAVEPGSVHLKSASGREVRVENGRILVDGKPLANGGSSVVVVTDEPGGTKHEEVVVRTVRTDGDTPVAPLPPMPPIPPLPPLALGEIEAPIAPLPPMPGLSTMRFESTERLGRGVTTSLGSKEMEGVRADGRSTVWTIAAGQIGNQKPIEISSESWYAPDLQVTVYSRYHDPRTGDSIYRLEKIRRGEPSAELFKAPAS